MKYLMHVDKEENTSITAEYLALCINYMHDNGSLSAIVGTIT